MSVKIPRHIAIIMDGNGRWSEENGKSRQEGHLAGFHNIRQVAQTVYEAGIEYLTLFAFSTENWNRPKAEIEYIVNFTKLFDENELQKYHKAGIRILHIGHNNHLNATTQAMVKRTIELTQKNTKFNLCVAFDYGGRDEIIQAVRNLIKDDINADQVDEKMLSKYMMTAGIPDPDLVIRTSGENRLSNFLIWQTAYAEYYTSPTYWPDFDKTNLNLALEEYAKRQRRFGGR